MTTIPSKRDQSGADENLVPNIRGLCDLAHRVRKPWTAGNMPDHSAALLDGSQAVWSHADAPHPTRLLRLRRERPRRRAAEQRDELAPPHGRPSSGLGPHITTPLRKNAAVHHSKNCALMSQMGQTEKSRQRDGAAGLPSTADIFEECCHGRCAPKATVGQVHRRRNLEVGQGSPGYRHQARVKRFRPIRNACGGQHHEWNQGI
jgi:hypothetical protein